LPAEWTDALRTLMDDRRLADIRAATVSRVSGHQAGTRPPRNGQFSKSNPGKTGVPSFRTASKLRGSSPRSLRIVGATCVVSTKLVTVFACMFGLETNNITL